MSLKIRSHNYSLKKNLLSIQHPKHFISSQKQKYKNIKETFLVFKVLTVQRRQVNKQPQCDEYCN